MNHFRLRLVAPLTVGVSLALFAGLARVNAAEIFVNADAIGNNDGTSWENAFTDLQHGLAASEGGDQVWVAAATYKPAGTQGDRTATFQLINGVGLYGGFAGKETKIDQRDSEVNVTVLSGDLNGDDGDDFANNYENSYHVVTGSETDATAALDGFTVTGGNADGDYPDGYGGGMYTFLGSPTIANCLFTGNSALSYGGGMYHAGNSPGSVVRCEFSGNSAYGGGAYTIVPRR